MMIRLCLKYTNILDAKICSLLCFALVVSEHNVTVTEEVTELLVYEAQNELNIKQHSLQISYANTII